MVHGIALTSTVTPLSNVAAQNYTSKGASIPGPRTTSFEQILSTFTQNGERSKVEIPGAALHNLTGLMHLQKRVYELNVQVEVVSRVTEALLATVRKLQNGQ